MSPSASARLQGFRTLLAQNGEILTFRAGLVGALVDRNVDDRKIKSFDFEPRDTSEIQIEIGSVLPIPRPGEEFSDEIGNYHRIQTVKRLDIAIACRCDVSFIAPAATIGTEGGETITTEGGEALSVG